MLGVLGERHCRTPPPPPPRGGSACGLPGGLPCVQMVGLTHLQDDPPCTIPGLLGFLCCPHRSSLAAMPRTVCCCPCAGLMVPDLLGAPLTLLPELVSARLLPFTLGALTAMFVPELIRAQYRLKQRNANQRAWPGGLLDPLGRLRPHTGCCHQSRSLSQILGLQCGMPLKLLSHWPL